MLLDDRLRGDIQKRLASLSRPITLVYFTQELECPTCRETGQLLRETAELSDKVRLEVYNFQLDREAVETFKVDKIPATVVMAEKDYGIRFYGIPSGYEFSTFLDTMLAVSRGDSELAPETREKIRAVTKPLHLQVFVTPTCPYCPAAVRLAHRMALESDLIRADMIEATEFPHLVTKYQVRGVPLTVVNETVFIEGARPEPLFVDAVLSALGDSLSGDTSEPHRHP